jgi:hypothetical protein
MSSKTSGTSAQDFFGSMSLGSKVAGGSAVVLFISVFLDWFSVSVAGGFGGGSGSGWSWYTGAKLCALIALVAIGVLVAEARGMASPLPWPWSIVILALGVLGFVLAGFHIFSTPGSLPGVSVSSSYGCWLATIAAAGIAAGGWLKMSES